MTRTRSMPAVMGKWLNQLAQPCYAIDADRTLFFLNAACEAWLGVTPESLCGLVCRYQARTEVVGPPAIADRLCPPPEVLTLGKTVHWPVAMPTAAGIWQRWPTEFRPLYGKEGTLAGVLAFVAPQPLAELETGKLEPAADLATHSDAPHDWLGSQSVQVTGNEPHEARLLHERLQRIQVKLAGRFHINRLLGSSPGMQLVRQQVELAAGSRCPVLVCGPSGSGRNLVARAIHYFRDPQQAGSLVPLDAGLLSVEILEDTLRTLTAGGPLRRTAKQSTLIINSVEELPRDVQLALARWLARSNSGLRVMATARTPLAELPPERQLQPELTCLLSTLVIRLPLLRDRPEDLPLVAQSVLEECNAHATKQVGGFVPEALDALVHYTWPGDWDELASVIRDAHGATVGPLIGPVDLPRRLQQAHEAQVFPRQVEQPIELEALLAQVETELIQRALARSRGNKSKAAQLLGLTRPRLYRRLVQLGLESELPAEESEAAEPGGTES